MFAIDPEDMPGDSASSDSEEEYDSGDEDFEAENLFSILEEDDGTAYYILPQHQKCVAHTLNLIAAQDILKIKDVRFNRRYRFVDNIKVKSYCGLSFYILAERQGD